MGIDSVNSFTAKFKNVVWEYFHVHYYISFYEAKNGINKIYLVANENGLNITENIAVPA